MFKSDEVNGQCWEKVKIRPPFNYGSASCYTRSYNFPITSAAKHKLDIYTDISWSIFYVWKKKKDSCKQLSQSTKFKQKVLGIT